MKKRFLIIIILILLLFTFNFSYAESENLEEDSNVFWVKNTSVTIDEKIEMEIDINKIEYEKSIVEITSTTEMEEILVKDDQGLELEKDNEKVIIEINKNNIMLDKIILSYKLPKNLKVEDTIIIKANVVNLEAPEEEQNYSETITIVEKQEDESKKEKNENTAEVENTKKSDTVKEEKSSDNAKQSENNQEKTSVSSSILKAAAYSAITSKTGTFVSNSSSSKSSSKEENVTYKGSNNNYLSSLNFEGYELNRKFSKENDTYFLTVNSDISFINLTAEAEDNKATIKVYGNEDLQKNNKILITVTAENGNTRNYRIYLNKSTKISVNKISASSQIQSALEDKLELHAAYYFKENYAEINQEIKQGENILQYANGTYLIAPYDCVVTELKLPTENEICTNEHYITIKSTKQLKIQVSVDESKISKIILGSQTQITIPALDSKEYTGTITSISESASKGKFTVTTTFENDGNAKIGMSANLEL